MPLLTLMLATQLLLIFTQSKLINAGEWSYDGQHGQEHWDKQNKVCSAGRLQSPIDIETKKAKPDESLSLTLHGYQDEIPESRWLLNNNGHTAQLDLLPGGKIQPKVTGAAVDGQTYKFLQLHFHWHYENTRGTEHQIDGQGYALEMHFVHQNVKYEGLPQALNNKDGLVVLGTLFQVTRKNNTYLHPIIETLKRIDHQGQNSSLRSSITLGDLLPNDLDRFYKYQGSLTTPPCSEAATWILFAEVASISEAQLKEFRQLEHELHGENRSVPIAHNVREIQKLRKRDVYYSGGQPVLAASSLLTTTVAAIAVLMISRLS